MEASLSLSSWLDIIIFPRLQRYFWLFSPVCVWWWCCNVQWILFRLQSSRL